MKKFIKLLAILTTAIASITVLNGLFCVGFIIFNQFIYDYYWQHLAESFYILELILTIAAAVLVIFLQSLWILYQSKEKQSS